MRRGELWWAELPPSVGHRPVLILTRDEVLNSIDSIVVAIVTRMARGLRSEIVLGGREGLPVRTVASMDNLMTVPRARLIRLLGNCAQPKIQELNAAITFALDVKLP